MLWGDWLVPSSDKVVARGGFNGIVVAPLDYPDLLKAVVIKRSRQGLSASKRMESSMVKYTWSARGLDGPK